MKRLLWIIRLRRYLRSIWMIPGATLFIVGCALSWFAYDEYESILAQEFRALESNNRIAAAQIADVLRNLEPLLNHVAQERGMFSPAQRAAADAHLRDEMRRYPEIRSLVITNAQGVVEYTAIATLRGFDASQRDYFVAHLDQPLQPNFYVSRPYTTTVGKDSSIAFSMAVRDSAGRLQGVVVAGVNPQFFESVLAQVVPEGEGAISVLFNARGDVIYQIPSPQKAQTLDLRQDPLVQQHVAAKRLQTRHIGRFLAGDEVRMVAIHKLGGSGLSVALSKYASPVLATWRRNVALRVAVFLLACGVALGLTWQVRRREITLDRVNAQLTVDIAARKEAEASLTLYASVFRNSTEAMVITDSSNAIVAVNAAFSRSTGYAFEEVRGKNPRLLASGQTPPETYQALWAGLAAHDRWQGELWDRRKDGSVYPKWISIAVVRNPAGVITHYLANFVDITERKYGEFAMQNLADALQVSRQRLRELAAESEGRLESERKQIARDVHDELGQVLAALRMDISLVRMRWGAMDAELMGKMASMKALVDRAIKGVRNVAAHLRPMALDAGLVPAIGWLCNGFTKNTGVACVCQPGPGDIQVDETLAVVMFRIVQEALTNITRHARASAVRVSIEVCDNFLRVEVTDNGQGFDLAQSNEGRSFGLLGMRERALAINGNIDVFSTPGHGTVVVLTMPMGITTKDAA